MVSVVSRAAVCRSHSAWVVALVTVWVWGEMRSIRVSCSALRQREVVLDPIPDLFFGKWCGAECVFRVVAKGRWVVSGVNAP